MMKVAYGLHIAALRADHCWI